MAVILKPQEEDQNKAQIGPDGKPLQTVGTATPTGQAPAGSPTAMNQANNLAQRQGSGRFTNLSKYIQANKGSGERIASQIGQNIGQNLSKEQAKAKDYYGKLGETIVQAKGVVGQGAQFQSDLGQIGSQIGQNTIGAQDSQAFKDWQAKQTQPNQSQPNKTLESSLPVGMMYDKSGNIVPINTSIVDPGHNQVKTPEIPQLSPEELYQKYQQEMLGSRPQQNLDLIDSFTSDPNKFRTFQDIQAGRGIDENLLALQQQRAYNQSVAAQQQAEQAKQQLGNETGRFELLRNQFGGANRPGYTTGQQRLDQVLLGQGGGLGQVQGDVNQKAREAQQQAKQAQARAVDVSGLTKQEKNLMSGINTQAKTNEEAYRNMLSSYIDPTNRQRQAEVQDLTAAIQSYNQPYTAGGENQRQSGFTADQMARLGLTDANTGVYTVFRGPGGVSEAQHIVSVGPEAQNVQDIANQQDVARYQSLAKILGMSPKEQAITQASQLGDSYSNLEGEAALANRLAAAQAEYNKLAKNTLNTSTDQFAGNRIYATPEELLAQGRNAIEYQRGMYNQIVGGLNDWNASTAGGAWSDDNLKKWITAKKVPLLLNQFKDYLAEQNYNQTLGGRRNTFLDTEAAAKLAATGATPKMDATPITGEDPSLAYLNQIVGKMPIQGS